MKTFLTIPFALTTLYACNPSYQQCLSPSRVEYCKDGKMIILDCPGVTSCVDRMCMVNIPSVGTVNSYQRENDQGRKEYDNLIKKYSKHLWRKIRSGVDIRKLNFDINWKHFFPDIQITPGESFDQDDAENPPVSPSPSQPESPDEQPEQQGESNPEEAPPAPAVIPPEVPSPEQSPEISPSTPVPSETPSEGSPSGETPENPPPSPDPPAEPNNPEQTPDQPNEETYPTEQEPNPPEPSEENNSSTLFTCEEFNQSFKANGYPIPDNSYCESLQKYSQDIGKITTRKETCMFLAHTQFETSGYQFLREVRCQQNNACKGDYFTPGQPAGQLFYGRGLIQLSWYPNYVMASEALFNDQRLTENPNIVADDQSVAIRTSLWYWQNRVHQFAKTGQFGATTKAINGAIECSPQSDPSFPQKRFDHYVNCLKVFGVNDDPDPSGCR